MRYLAHLPAEALVQLPQIETAARLATLVHRGWVADEPLVRRDFVISLMFAGGLAATDFPDRTPAPAPSSPHITIFIQFEAKHSSLAVEQMKAEVAALLEPAGLRVGWQLIPEAYGRDFPGEPVVASFKGRCDADDSQSRRRPRHGPLGWTHITEGVVLPFIDIHCDRVLVLIEGRLNGSSGLRREIEFGRALGRVATHELLHVLTASKEHFGWGVTKPLYTPDDLTGNCMILQRDEISRLKKLRSSRIPATKTGDAAGQ